MILSWKTPIELNMWLFFQQPEPISTPKNLFLPGGFALARYGASKVNYFFLIKWLWEDIPFYLCSVMFRQPLGSIPVSVWICSLRDSFHTTSSPFMFRLSWSSACPGCPSGLITSRPRPGWRSPSPRCSPCQPPHPPSTPPCLLCPTSRWEGDQCQYIPTLKDPDCLLSVNVCLVFVTSSDPLI